MLDVRVFDDATKRRVYQKQTAETRSKGVSNCPLCAMGHEARRTKIWGEREMEADHVEAWSKGGATTEDNCRCSALRTTATKATVRLRGIAPFCQYTPKKQCRRNLRHCFFSSRIVIELFHGSLFTVHFFSNCFISSCFSSFCISTFGLKRLASAPVFLSDASLNFSKLLSCKRCDMGSFTRKLSRLA